MKIFDCTTFFDENLMLEVRFNILNKHVDKFVISEAKYSHSGEKKKLNFNIKKFNEFKQKIIYLVIENEPDDIVYEKRSDNSFSEKNSYMRLNSIKRIAYQRDKLIESLNEEVPKEPTKSRRRLWLVTGKIRIALITHRLPTKKSRLRLGC